jgi:hypothetical protein
MAGNCRAARGGTPATVSPSAAVASPTVAGTTCDGNAGNRQTAGDDERAYEEMDLHQTNLAVLYTFRTDVS